MDYLIAIDIGTSSTRSVAFSIDGKMLYNKSIPLSIESREADWQEQDAAAIFRAVRKTMKKVVKKMGTPPMGASISAVMHSVLAVDEEGKALTPMLIWADNRSEAYAAQLKDTRQGSDIYQHTGTPIHPMSPLCKIAWWREHEPAVFEQAYKFVGIKEYILFHLFGHWLVDYSIASATGLFDNQKQEWYAPALKFAGITSQQLSEPVPTTFVLSDLKPEYATQLALNENTPFVIGASDGCLANLGALTLEQGDVNITLGTSAAIRATSKKAVQDKSEQLFTYILTEDCYITGGASNNGGMAYAWFSSHFLNKGWSKRKALKKIKKIRKTPAGADGLLFLPYLTGERAPVWDAQARGLFYGISKIHTQTHFQRAVLEGILYNVLQIGKALEAVTGEIHHICVNGGLAEVDTVMQLLADIFGKPAHRLDAEEGSAFGAFILGMKALGLIGDFAEAEKMVKVEKRFEPDAENHAIYQKQFAVFERLYLAFKTLDDG